MTHASRRPRNKKYRPKHINVPVMPEMQQEFAFAGHGALAALRLAPNLDALEQLAAIFNVLAVALDSKGRSSPILASGMRALQDVVDRHARTGAIGIGRFELPPIENAVIECEQLVRSLDVLSLHQARLKTVALERLTATEAEASA